MAKPLSTSPLLTIGGVDMMYCQLTKIHAIASVQLAECAHGFSLTQPLAQFRLGSVGRDPSRCLLRQGWHVARAPHMEPAQGRAWQLF
jgi:hypothetical protein